MRAGHIADTHMNKRTLHGITSYSLVPSGIGINLQPHHFLALDEQTVRDLLKVQGFIVVRDLQLTKPEFAELYRRHVLAIYDFCAHRLSSREAAEDTTQAVFMRAIGSLAECRNPESFRS